MELILRRPTALLRQRADPGAVELPYGGDCYPVDLPIELAYTTDAKEVPLGHAPPPNDPAITVLVQSIVWAETTGEPVLAHDDSRGILVFDAFLLEGVTAPLPYAAVVAKIADAGFWVSTPRSAADLVRAILESLLVPEAEAERRGRSHYPNQWATDDGWLVDLWRHLHASIDRRLRAARSR